MRLGEVYYGKSRKFRVRGDAIIACAKKIRAKKKTLFFSDVVKGRYRFFTCFCVSKARLVEDENGRVLSFAF